MTNSDPTFRNEGDNLIVNFFAITVLNDMKFQEKQTFWTWWMIVLMIFLLLSTVNYDVVNIFKGDFSKMNFNPAFWIVVGIIIFFSFINLKTTINEEGIAIQFFPFLLKTKLILWSQLDDLYVKDYNPIADYGGWGYRNGSQGKAYNTKGSVGLQLIFKDGSRLLIGTQKKDELIRIAIQVNQEFLKNPSE
ncbi:hypothetical protein [Sphingobacterium faecium]|uniref:hypothetical protein n=1 Tax=Sphingobacterium faecium TaxID=34087 RepID=UPI003208C053